MRYRTITPRIKNGQSTLEYVIILAVVIVAIVGVATVFKEDIAKAYNAAQANIPNPAAGAGTSGGGAQQQIAE